MAMNAGPQTVTPTKPITAAMDRLKAEIDMAASEVGCVEGELATILAPTSKPTVAAGRKPPECPGLASAIDEHADEIHDIAERLREIRQRSQL